MFTIHAKGATLDNVNGRKENHGNDLELAADIKITVHAGNFVLDCFNLDGERIQDALWNDEGLPRFETIDPIKFTRGFKDARVSIGHSDEPLMVLAPCKLAKFVGKPGLSNSVKLSFRIQCNPTEDEIARLFELMQEEISIVVESINEELPLDAGEDDPATAAAEA